jgi:hypothetical protein
VLNHLGAQSVDVARAQVLEVHALDHDQHDRSNLIPDS